MSFLQKLKDLWCKEYYYITNREILKKYVDNEVQFALDYQLEFCFVCYIYVEEIKHRISALNLDADRSKKKPSLGVHYYCDNKEFLSFDDLFDECFFDLSGEFQVMVEDNEPEVFVREATRIQLN